MLLNKIKSAATVTLITLDAAIPTNKKQLLKLGLEPDGWKLATSKEARPLLTNFKNTYKKTLEDLMETKEGKLRLGGSVFTTLYKLLEYKPEIKSAAAFVPLGTGDGLRGELDSLVDYVNERRKILTTEIEEFFDKRLKILETVSSGLSPVIISFYQKGKRSMILLRDEQEIRPHGKSVSGLTAPTLFLVDTRELVQKSFKKAAVSLARRPKTFVVVGLGTESILEKSIPELKELLSSAKGEYGFSGNKGEVDVLVKHWNGISTAEELVKTANLRFLLETNGQKGATLYFLNGSKVEKGRYSIPKKEIYYGDTTNAGDVFLAATLFGLMSKSEKELSAEKLREVLRSASKRTLTFLRSRT